MYTFLRGLPAILGIAGFFAYLWAGQTRIGGEILKQITKKLRVNPNIDVKEYGALTPAKVGKLIQTDAQVRSLVNEQDQQLLRLLIIYQHAVTVIVLLVCAGLIGLSVWLVARPEPLNVIPKSPFSMTNASGGLLVDLDPIGVEWTYTGKDEAVAVCLENVDSPVRTARKTIGVNVRSLVFTPDEVRAIAADRRYHHVNRIRSVVEWPGNRAVSEPKNLLVGIEVELLLGGRLIAPNGQERVIHTELATIDQSTAEFPADYCFTSDLAGRASTGPIVVPLRSCNDDSEVRVPGLERFDWSKPFGLVYNGPDDPRIVRTKVSGATHLNRQ